MKNKYNIQVSWYVHSVQSSRRASAWEAMVRLALAWWICFPTVIFIWNSFLFLLISLNISNNNYFTLTAWRYYQASGWGGGGNLVNSWWWWGCATRFSKSWSYFRPKNVIFNTRFQTCLLGRNYVIIPYIRAQTKKILQINLFGIETNVHTLP